MYYTTALFDLILNSGFYITVPNWLVFGLGALVVDPIVLGFALLQHKQCQLQLPGYMTQEVIWRHCR